MANLGGMSATGAHVHQHVLKVVTKVAKKPKEIAIFLPRWARISYHALILTNKLSEPQKSFSLSLIEGPVKLNDSLIPALIVRVITRLPWHSSRAHPPPSIKEDTVRLCAEGW